MFNPNISVESVQSIFNFEIQAAVTHLPVNEKMQYWIFDPEGANVHWEIIETDKYSNFKTNWGINLIYHRTGHSSPLKKGKYSLGINRNIYQGKERMTLQMWTKLTCDKKLLHFTIDYPKDSFLEIDGNKEVPWSMHIDVNGRLWYRNEPFPWCSGTTDMQNRKIIITGNNIINTECLTDGFAKFSTRIQVGNKPELNCSIQAQYEGDEIFFDECHSNTIFYNIIKHDTSLSLAIEPLIPKLSDTLEKNSTHRSIKVGRFYVLEGKLIDKTSDCAVRKRIVNFIETENLSISSAVTDAEGSYSVCIKIANLSKSVNLRAVFEGDQLYNGSTTDMEFKAKEETPSQIHAFKVFRAFESFRHGFLDTKELPQIRSCIWLLSLLDANPIPLGIFDSKGRGEEIVKNGDGLLYSGDLLANFDGVPLVIDCTVAIPTIEKIDKIYNTAKYLSEVTRTRFVPLIISNKPSKAVKEVALHNRVLILDQNDILEIADLVSNEHEDAKHLFSNKLKAIDL